MLVERDAAPNRRAAAPCSRPLSLLHHPPSSLPRCAPSPLALPAAPPDLALPSHPFPPLLHLVISQMSLLSAVLPADYAYVVAVGTVGVYSVLQYATIKVSGARKAAGVKCASPLSLTPSTLPPSLPRRDS